MSNLQASPASRPLKQFPPSLLNDAILSPPQPPRILSRRFPGASDSRQLVPPYLAPIREPVFCLPAANEAVDRNHDPRRDQLAVSRAVRLGHLAVAGQMAPQPLPGRFGEVAVRKLEPLAFDPIEFPFADLIAQA
jgi:hypothetical protein